MELPSAIRNAQTISANDFVANYLVILISAVRPSQ
jgi:hypothetical protein